jgi:hypothetical protein
VTGVVAVLAVACSPFSDEPTVTGPGETGTVTPGAPEPREAAPPTPLPGSDESYRQDLVAALEHLDDVRSEFGDMMLTMTEADIDDRAWQAAFSSCADEVVAAAEDVRAVDPPPAGAWVEVDLLVQRAMDNLIEATDLYRTGIPARDGASVLEAGACLKRSDGFMEAAIAAIP